MIKNGAVYFKWVVILIIFVLLFLTFRRCGSDINYSPPQTDTIRVVTDTVWKESKTDTQWVPKVRKVVEYKTEWKTDTLEIFEKIGADTANAFLKDYTSYKYYQDTIPTQYGYIVIIDTVTKNRIASRRTLSKFEVPVVTNNVTLREPKRVVAYLGFDVLGSQQSFLSAAGANFGLQFKNGKQYEVKAFLNKDGTPTYGFGFKLPIRLKAR